MVIHYELEVITLDKGLDNKIVQINIRDFGDRLLVPADQCGLKKNGKMVQGCAVMTDDIESAFDKAAFLLKERTSKKEASHKW